MREMGPGGGNTCGSSCLEKESAASGTSWSGTELEGIWEGGMMPAEG